MTRRDRNEYARRFEILFADVLAAAATHVLAQRIQDAQQAHMMAQEHQEAKELSQAVDDWLSGTDADHD
jgi:hypothetical protein